MFTDLKEASRIDLVLIFLTLLREVVQSSLTEKEVLLGEDIFRNKIIVQL